MVLEKKNPNCWYNKVCTYDFCTNCIRYSEMQYLMEHSGIPKKKQFPSVLLAGRDIHQFEELNDIKEDILNFVEQGENLYICSETTGNGKTSWAIKLMLKYFDQVWAGNGFKERGIFIHVPTFLNSLKNFSVDNPELEKVKKLLPEIDIIIWDDIAGCKLSDYDRSQLLTFLDPRIVSGLTNIYTCNVMRQDKLEEIIGNRLASRIWNCSTIIEFKGKDKRNGSTSNNI